METLWQDLKYGARMLWKSRGVTAAAVLSLALGIGANTTIFSVVNALFLRPLPGRDPGQLAAVYTSDYSGPLYGGSSYPDYLDFSRQNAIFTQLAAYSLNPLVLTSEKDGYRVLAEFGSGNFFDVLQLPTAYGRTFLPEEDEPGAPAQVVVLSHALWQRRFGSDPRCVGRTIGLNGHPFAIVGIAPPDFTGLTRGPAVDLWVPLATMPVLLSERNALENRGSRSLFLIGRLRPGVTLEQARANFQTIARQLHQAYPDHWTNVRGETRQLTVLPEREARVPPSIQVFVWAFVGLLQGVVGLVLLIACANVASLLLGRAASRRREVAIRLSMGASRLRVMRQLLTENLLLALLAASAALLLAMWTTDFLMAFQPPLPFRPALDLGVDSRVLLFAFGTALVSSLLFGLAPALHATRLNLVDVLKGDDGTLAGGARHRLRSAFVVGQVAFSLLLLIGAGLLLRSLANAETVNPGFDPANVVTAAIDLGPHGLSEAEGVALYSRLQERLQALTGVEAASWSSALPLGLDAGRRFVALQGYQPAPGEDMEIHFNVVGPGYFEAMRIPVVQGRSVNTMDTRGAPGVVVVNEAFVRRYWPGENPLGKRLSVGVITENDRPVFPLEVVGVVRDGKYVTLGEDPRPFIFYPHAQNYESAMTVVIRAPGDPGRVAEEVRAAVRSLEPRLPVYDVKTLDEHLGLALFPVRMAAGLLALMGALALVLAATGLYGVMSYSVSQRAREIGIRMALGARPRDVLALVLRRGMGLVLVGMILGLAGALALARLLRFLLFGIGPADPLAIAGMTALLLAVALLACYLPARRATQVDPMTALRYE